MLRQKASPKYVANKIHCDIVLMYISGVRRRIKEINMNIHLNNMFGWFRLAFCNNLYRCVVMSSDYAWLYVVKQHGGNFVEFLEFWS